MKIVLPASDHLAEQVLGCGCLEILGDLVRQFLETAELPQFLQHGTQEQQVGRACGIDDLAAQFITQFPAIDPEEAVDHLATLGGIGQRKQMLQPAALAQGIERRTRQTGCHQPDVGREESR